MIRNASYVQMSLVLANRALTEMSFFFSYSTPEERKMLDGPPFDFYYTSLQYMFIMEISKLLEPPPRTKYPLENHAGIEKASMLALKNDNDAYQQTHLEIVKDLAQLRNSKLYDETKKLRDKKFAHSDGDSEHLPLNIPRFYQEKVDEYFQLLEKLYSMWGKITTQFGYTFDSKVLHWDTKTKNFIKYHAVYKRYYYDNYLKAASEGYGLS